MAAQYGMAACQASAKTLVVLPVGVAHNTLDNSDSVQNITALLLPQPEKGTPSPWRRA